VALLVGCYDPSFQPGRPCTADFYCPGDQQCDQTQSPPLCVEALGDAGITDGEPPDSSLMPDGPMIACGGGCPASMPVCEQGTQTCRACIADADCPSDVCHELTGACVAEAEAIYLAPGGTGSACTRTAPCETMENAGGAMSATRHTVKVADGVYTDRIDLRARNGATSIIVSGSDRSAAGPEFVVTAGSNKTQSNITVVIEGITIRGTEQDGLETQGPTTLARVHIRDSGGTGVFSRGSTLRIIDSRIESNASNGVVANAGVVEIERTSILSNTNGGLRIDSGVAYSVINSVIALNGTTGTTTVGGVRILGTAPPSGPQVFKFNTVARNRASFAVALAVECGRPVTIVSSILASFGGAFNPETTGSCSATTSLYQANAPNAGGNITGEPMFVSATDSHVLPGSPAVDAAAPSGAPSVDIDGDPRTGNDAPDIGADELP